MASSQAMISYLEEILFLLCMFGFATLPFSDEVNDASITNLGSDMKRSLPILVLALKERVQGVADSLLDLSSYINKPTWQQDLFHLRKSVFKETGVYLL